MRIKVPTLTSGFKQFGLAVCPASPGSSQNGSKVASVCDRWLARTFFLFALLAPAVGQAESIDLLGYFFIQPVGPDAAIHLYDANTDLYTLDQTDAKWELRLRDSPIPPLVNDIIGTFSLTATINETGGFGGSYSWIGGSVSLGIAPGTEILGGGVDEWRI